MKGTNYDLATKRLLIESIDGSGYGIDTQTTEEKLKFCEEAFKSEYGWHVAQVGQQKALLNWLQGLPSACTVPFENHRIFEWGVENNFISKEATDDQICNFVERYWVACAAKLGQLFRRHNVPKMDGE